MSTDRRSKISGGDDDSSAASRRTLAPVSSPVPGTFPYCSMIQWYLSLCLLYSTTALRRSSPGFNDASTTSSFSGSSPTGVLTSRYHSCPEPESPLLEWHCARIPSSPAGHSCPTEELKMSLSPQRSTFLAAPSSPSKRYSVSSECRVKYKSPSWHPWMFVYVSFFQANPCTSRSLMPPSATSSMTSQARSP